MTCDVIDPITRQHYERDPRWIAKKAELYLKTAAWPTPRTSEPKPSSSSSTTSGSIRTSTPVLLHRRGRGPWNSGREKDNLGYRPRYKEGYFPVPPTDHYQDLRSEMVETMIRCGLNIECHHHEVATGGQCEIDQRFDTLVKSADNMMLYKYVIRNVAYQYGKTVTFMPKPLFGDNGSGMHMSPEHLEGRESAVCGRRLCGPEPDGASLHWRSAETRAGAVGDHRADHQQL